MTSTTPPFGPDDLLAVMYRSAPDRRAIWPFIQTLRQEGVPLDGRDIIPILASQEDATALIVATALVRVQDDIQERTAGICTLAPHGEWRSGQPTVVGAMVDPRLRGRGIGTRLLEEGIAMMRILIEELTLKTPAILVEAITPAGKALAERVILEPEVPGQMRKNRPEYADVEYHDRTSPLDFLP